ncbi:MAG: T9SS type A sorting domain-containing protein [Bacteroidetes bacterium]|nr:T9SS type A sorting domain-containing protein [Bacteroidota bacterium]
MKQLHYFFTLLVPFFFFCLSAKAQTIQYIMPEETTQHEGTWIQWPHNYLYGPWYREDVSPTFVSMTDALQTGEKVYIIAYDITELTFIQSQLDNANVPLTNIEFFIQETDDVWSRDNGPMFVYDLDDKLAILDWGFNGWGEDTPYEKCDVIPEKVSQEMDIPRIDLSSVVLEGGAIEHDGHGTMFATRSSVTHPSRNPNLTEAQIEDTLTTYMGITNFIWLDGIYGYDITDQHIDGFLKFANDSTIITMNADDLYYWYVSQQEINTIYNATNTDGDPYNVIFLPLTQNNVVTTYGSNLGYKGSYCNYYIGNEVVLVPTYNDPNDGVAIDILQGIHPNRTVLGIDVRNLYAYGGMIHCITQQQPVELNVTNASEAAGSIHKLFQNSPNPFSDFTTIAFDVEGNSALSLDVYNLLGQKIKRLRPDPTAKQVVLQASDFATGVYIYSLRVDGKVVASRKMIVE